MATLIKTINICKTFPGVKALSDVCIAFQKGEIHALVGENGAGKTTLMRVISAFTNRTAGRFIWRTNRSGFIIRACPGQGDRDHSSGTDDAVNLTIAQYIVPWTDADQQAGDGQKEAGGFKML
jgi:ATPase subunit of ABC transporter with duplicated ATPase domains